MKQKIYEIPIWDAFSVKESECPICIIEKKSDDDFIDALFTEMVMDVRLNPQLVKDYDFCHNHFEKLYRYPDKCGLAVLTNRILYSKRQSLKNISTVKNTQKKIGFKTFFSKDDNVTQNNHAKECLLCSRLEKDMDNYLETLINLWLKEDKFRQLYASSSGFCFEHFHQVLNLSEKVISNGSKLQEFNAVTLKLQDENLARLQEELEWFISKFDYRFANEPWKTSKDALIRSIQKLIGNYNNKI